MGKSIKVPDSDPGKKQFPIIALARPAQIGEVVEIQGQKHSIVRQISPQEVREQCLTMFNAIHERVPPGVTVYWYESHMVNHEFGKEWKGEYGP